MNSALRLKRVVPLLVGGVLVVGAGAATVGVILAPVRSANAEGAQPLPASPTSLPDTLAVHLNAAGQSYGSALAIPLVVPSLDLVSVVASNGISGYAKSVDLDGSVPATLQQAEARAANAVARTVPVYKSDGLTVVGSFSMPAPK